MRLLWKTLGWLVLAAVFALIVDSVVWQMKLAKGKGMGSVQVSRMSVISLKGKKEGYDLDGTDTVPCSHSVLPMPTSQGLFQPCWWIERHSTVETRY